MKKKNIERLILLSLLLVGFMSCEQLGGSAESGSGENLDRPENESKEAYIERIEKKYPYFDITVKSMKVFRSDEQLSDNDKKYLFEYLDAIKLVINSDEFEKRVLAENYHVFATFNKSTPYPDDLLTEYNNIEWGATYDSARMVYILRNFSYDLHLSRGPQSAVASAGICTLYNNTRPIVAAYGTNYDIEYHRGHGEVEFASDGGDIPKFIPGYNVTFKNTEVVDTLIHEMMHNMGFSHGSRPDNDFPHGHFDDPTTEFFESSQDPSRRVPAIISSIYNDFTFDSRYEGKAEEALDIKGYHEAKYGHLLEK